MGRGVCLRVTYADGEEDGSGDELGGLSGEGGEEHGADQGADDAGRRELAQHPVVRVAALSVRVAGDGGGAELREVDGGGGHRGRHAGTCGEDRGGGDAEAHAEGAVDELRHEACARTGTGCERQRAFEVCRWTQRTREKHAPRQIERDQELSGRGDRSDDENSDRSRCESPAA